MARRLTLVTGVGRAGQVGEAVARRFGRAGDTVLLVGHTAAETEARAAEMRADGIEAAAYAADLADAGQVAALAAQVVHDRGRALHALVNVAGGFAMSGPVAEGDPDVWTRMNRINVVTAATTTRAFLPALRAARGAIVYFASAAALPGAPVQNMWAYVASKQAVITLMRAVAREEAPAGVRANAVAPTSVRTTANLEAMGGDVQYVGRDDVAAAVWYLCSDDARAVSGQVVRLG